MTTNVTFGRKPGGSVFMRTYSRKGVRKLQQNAWFSPDNKKQIFSNSSDGSMPEINPSPVPLKKGKKKTHSVAKPHRKAKRTVAKANLNDSNEENAPPSDCVPNTTTNRSENTAAPGNFKFVTDRKRAQPPKRRVQASTKPPIFRPSSTLNSSDDFVHAVPSLPSTVTLRHRQRHKQALQRSRKKRKKEVVQNEEDKEVLLEKAEDEEQAVAVTAAVATTLASLNTSVEVGPDMTEVTELSLAGRVPIFSSTPSILPPGRRRPPPAHLCDSDSASVSAIFSIEDSTAFASDTESLRPWLRGRLRKRPKLAASSQGTLKGDGVTTGTAAQSAQPKTNDMPPMSLPCFDRVLDTDSSAKQQPLTNANSDGEPVMTSPPPLAMDTSAGQPSQVAMTTAAAADAPWLLHPKTEQSCSPPPTSQPVLKVSIDASGPLPLPEAEKSSLPSSSQPHSEVLLSDASDLFPHPRGQKKSLSSSSSLQPSQSSFSQSHPELQSSDTSELFLVRRARRCRRLLETMSELSSCRSSSVSHDSVCVTQQHQVVMRSSGSGLPPLPSLPVTSADLLESEEVVRQQAPSPTPTVSMMSQKPNQSQATRRRTRAQSQCQLQESPKTVEDGMNHDQRWTRLRTQTQAEQAQSPPRRASRRVKEGTDCNQRRKTRKRTRSQIQSLTQAGSPSPGKQHLQASPWQESLRRVEGGMGHTTITNAEEPSGLELHQASLELFSCVEEGAEGETHTGISQTTGGFTTANMSLSAMKEVTDNVINMISPRVLQHCSELPSDSLSSIGHSPLATSVAPSLEEEEEQEERKHTEETDDGEAMRCFVEELKAECLSRQPVVQMECAEDTIEEDGGARRRLAELKAECFSGQLRCSRGTCVPSLELSCGSPLARQPEAQTTRDDELDKSLISNNNTAGDVNGQGALEEEKEKDHTDDDEGKEDGGGATRLMVEALKATCLSRQPVVQLVRLQLSPTLLRHCRVSSGHHTATPPDPDAGAGTREDLRPEDSKDHAPSSLNTHSSSSSSSSSNAPSVFNTKSSSSSSDVSPGRNTNSSSSSPGGGQGSQPKPQQQEEPRAKRPKRCPKAKAALAARPKMDSQKASTSSLHDADPQSRAGTGRKAGVSGFSAKRWGRSRTGQRKHNQSQDQTLDLDLKAVGRSAFYAHDSLNFSRVGLAKYDKEFASPGLVEDLNMLSTLGFSPDASLSTHLWNRLKAALSVHKKRNASITPHRQGLPGMRTPRLNGVNVGPDVCSSPALALLPRLLLSPAGAASSFACEEEISDAEKVYEECGQEGPLSFSQCIPPARMRRCRKIGEGTFGEVFSTTDAQGEPLALKIIPLEGEQKVNGEAQKTFGEILHEIIISKELSMLDEKDQNRTDGFIGLKNMHCVQGSYPKQLLSAWDKFDQERGSDNDRPDFYSEEQFFLILEFEFGGSDLESMSGKLASLAQAKSILQQVTAALAVAEQALSFEHRDLHWGNILVKSTKAQQCCYSLQGQSHGIDTQGVQVNIIDYSLSRLEIDGLTVSCDISTDEELFMGQGDYQFEIYRKMREENENEWSEYHPHSNVLWLHYLVDKLLGMKYKGSTRSAQARAVKSSLLRFNEEVLSFRSATEVLKQSSLFQT